MNNINDGGPAYPHLMSGCQVAGESEHFPGLTKREHFAALLMPVAAGIHGATTAWTEENRRFMIAQEAVKLADALIAALGPQVPATEEQLQAFFAKHGLNKDPNA